MPLRLFTAALAALALSPAGEAAADEWEYRLSPYLWAPSFDADLAIGDDSDGDGDSDSSFLDVLDFAFLVSGEARRGDWALIGEFNFLALSEDAELVNGALSAEALLDGYMARAAASYRFLHDDRSSAEAFAGVRAWWIDAEIDLQRISNPRASRNWVDPIVGLRGAYDVTEKITVAGLGEIGGFGVGSDLQWELIARAGYRFTDHVGLALGYRHLDLDFQDDGLVLDAQISGPFLALDLMW